jgi:hypothetical protein
MKHRTVASDASARNVDTTRVPGQIGEQTHEQVGWTALLQQRITALESDVIALKNESDMMLPHGTANLHHQGDTGRSAQLSEAEMQTQRKQEEDRIFTQIDRSFSAQPIDHSWSTSMTGRIKEHIRTQQLMNSNVDSIECRSSACRVEVSIHDGADLAVIRDNFRFHMADVMSSGASKQDETGKFIIFLAKDPQALGMTAQP